MQGLPLSSLIDRDWRDSTVTAPGSHTPVPFAIAGKKTLNELTMLARTSKTSSRSCCRIKTTILSIRRY